MKKPIYFALTEKTDDGWMVKSSEGRILGFKKPEAKSLLRMSKGIRKIIIQDLSFGWTYPTIDVVTGKKRYITFYGYKI